MRRTAALPAGIVRVLARSGEVAAVVALWLMAGAMLYEVVARYLFNSPTGWSDVAASQLLPGVAMLAAGHTLLAGGHVRVDGLVRRLSPRIQAVLAVFGDLVGAAVLLVLVWYSIELVEASYVRNERGFAGVHTFAAWVPQVVVPVGLSVMLMVQLLLLAEGVAALRGRRRVSPAAAAASETGG